MAIAFGFLLALLFSAAPYGRKAAMKLEESSE
jgi:hypothetical protein